MRSVPSQIPYFRGALEDIEDYNTIKLLEGAYAVQDPGSEEVE